MKSKFLKFVLILLVAGVVGIGFLLSTETGLRWLLSQGTYLIPGKLKIETVHGRLIGPVEIEGLQYLSPDYTVGINRLSFDWHPISLIRGTVKLHYLYGEGVDVLRLASPERQVPDTPILPHRISLPFQMIINDLIVKRIILSSKGVEKRISINEFALKARAEKNHIQIERLYVTAPTFTATTVGGYNPSNEPPVDISIDWQADVSGKFHLTGTGKIMGDEKRLTLSHETNGSFGSKINMVLNDISENNVPIESLDVTTPLFKLEGNGILKPQGEHPIDIFLNWRTRIRDYPQLTGKGNLIGNATQLQLIQEIEDPFKTQISAVINNILGGMFWNADVSIADLNPVELKATWPETSLKAQIHGSGNLTSFNTQGTFHASYQMLQSVQGAFKAEYTPDKLRLHNMDLTMADSDTNLNVQAEWKTQDKQRVFKVQGNWHRVSWPLKGKALIRSPQGNFEATGSLQDYNIHITGLFSGKDIPDGNWTASGKGGPGMIRLTTVRGDILDGAIEGAGTLTWYPHFSWQFGLQGKSLNPGKKWEAWPGNLEVHALTQGTIKDGALDGKLDIKRLTGVLRGFDFRARTNLDVKNDQYNLSILEVSSGSGQLSASGYLKDEWKIAWQVSAPQMDTLLPASGGSLTARGRVTGPRSLPRIVAVINGENIKVEAYQTAKLQASLDVDFQKKQDLLIDLNATGLQFEKQSVDSISIQGRGRMDNHHLQAHLVSGQETVDLRIDGQLKDDLWYGLLNKADIKSLTFGNWSLENQSTIKANLQHIQVEKLCFVSRGAFLCSDTTWQKKNMWDVNIETENLPFATFQTFLPPEITLTGTVSGKATANISQDKSIQGVFDFHAPLGTINVPVAQGRYKTVSYERGLIKGKIDDSGLAGHVSLSLPDEGDISIAFNLPEFNTPKRFSGEQSAHGELQVNLKALNILAALLQDVDNPEGLLSINISVSGQLSRPVLAGRMTLEGGGAHIPRLGVVWKHIHINAKSDNGDMIHFSGGATSGEGNLSFTGRAFMDPEKNWDILVNVEGERFEVINLPEAFVLLSPLLEIKFHGNRLDIGGETTIPEATIKPRDLTRASKVSQDVVFVDEMDEEVTKKPIDIYSQVKVTFGDKVTFEGFGVNGRIAGSILVVDEPQKLTTGQGELQLVDATYEIYKKKLTLEHGNLIFLGNIIEDPFIDVDAVQKIDDVTVGVRVRETLRKPRFTLFSQPPMPETDILSYLVLGRPINQVSHTEGRTLMDVASVLGMGGGNQLAKRIGGMFGLEEVQIKSGTKPEETTLIVGKYLSPRLYINYGIGLLEPVSTLRIRYQLSSRWFLQSETGTEKGADLIYTIER